MVITYNSSEDADETREPDDREEEYFRSYRSYMTEMLYGHDLHEEEPDDEDAEEACDEDEEEPPLTDEERASLIDELSQFGTQGSFFKPGVISKALRFSVRLIHFLKAGESSDPADDRRAERHRQALLRELEHPNPEVWQVAEDYFYSPEGTMKDLLQHLMDFCRAQNDHQRRAQHPFRRGDIADWAESPLTRSQNRGGTGADGFTGPHMN